MKLSLTDIANLQSETTVVAAINANNQAIETALENTLSRDGTTPNTMSATLDLNGHRIINAGAPSAQTDVLRLVDIGGVPLPTVAAISALAVSAQASATAASASAAAAASFVGSALTTLAWATPRTITITGAVNGTSIGWDGSTNLSFGVTIPAGTIVSGALAPGAVTGNLGYTPLNKSGDILTGDVRLNYVAASLSSDSIGFRGIPVVTYNNNHTASVDDIGKMFRHTDGSAYNWYLDTTAVTPYPIGATFVYRNTGSGVITIYRAGGVSLRIAGAATDQNVSLAQWGEATAVHEANNVWVISGSGIS